jgi:hypothetical protein
MRIDVSEEFRVVIHGVARAAGCQEPKSQHNPREVIPLRIENIFDFRRQAWSF